jgi:diguanylate cyclase (GGDEF)-like protein
MTLPSILIVDDEPNNFDVVEALLGDQNYVLNYAASGEDAIASLEVYRPDIILLDVMMPGLDGVQVCQRIKAMEQWQAVPIIMVTAISTKEDLSYCLRTGADDFISKPLNALELRARVGSMLRIKRQYDALQTALKQQEILEAEKVELLQNRNVQLEQQVEQRTLALQQTAEQMRYNALHDPLTHLANRTLMLERIADAIQRVQKGEAYRYAVLFIDLDRFKVINDSLGHLVGDRLLVIIAQRLKAYLRSTDTIARFGGDEFVILLDAISSPEAAIVITQRILKDCQTPLLLDGYQLFIGMSIGVVVETTQYVAPSDLIRDADIAMYQAKARGKNLYQVFDAQMHTQALRRLTLESDLRKAIEHEEFEVYYQPIMDILQGQLVGFEALVRWHHPIQGFISPGEFVSVAEETGLVSSIDRWVSFTACRQLAQWQQQWLDYEALKISINLSAQDLQNPHLLQDIDGLIRASGLSGHSITLEITESMLIEDVSQTIDLLTELKARQLQISIDDFGTGYSSLNYLHRLPADNLKIDRAFVSQMQHDHRNHQVVDTIITLGKQLDMAVVAEGVETQDQLQRLQQLGCRFAQGYLFARPMPAKEIETQFLNNPSGLQQLASAYTPIQR